ELREKLDKVGKGFNLVQKDTQSINAKVETLSREREERPTMVSMHESGESFEEGYYSEGGRSSQSSMGGRHERLERVERNRREERMERHGRREEEPRREKIDMANCKIPLFLENCKLEVYVDWELKVEQILGCFDLHG
ncbi:hypothetical protein CR513_28256, partial [Mucuna pruriens]